MQAGTIEITSTSASQPASTLDLVRLVLPASPHLVGGANRLEGETGAQGFFPPLPGHWQGPAWVDHRRPEAFVPEPACGAGPPGFRLPFSP